MAAVATSVGLDAHAETSRTKLRVGVFTSSRSQPRWIAEAFSQVASSPGAEIVLIADALRPARPGSLVWRAWRALDRRAFSAGEDPMEPCDLAAVVRHGRLVDAPAPDAGSEALAAWQRELAAAALDVAFLLGDFDERLVEGVPSAGLWRFWFGEHERGLDEVGVHEVVEGLPLTRSGLVTQTGGGERRLVWQSSARTCRFSAARNQDEVLRKTAQFPGRALAAMRRGGLAWVESGEALPASHGRPATPATSSDIGRCARLGVRVAQRALERALGIEQWFIGYRFQAPGAGDPFTALDQFRWLMPPQDRLWADPFPVMVAGRHFVFFEELVFARGRAHIAMIELDASGRHSPSQPVLERDYHLSYPFLLEQDGQLYMVPESSANETVELWRCVEFPSRWRLEKQLLKGLRCADATIHRGQNRWWMFATVAPRGGSLDDELHIFHADRLDGDWRPHAANPVRSDVRGARPAGRLFVRDGALYRPAQIDAPIYGAGVSVNRVLKLTPDEYAEREVRRIEPSSASRVQGVHTINEAGGLAVVDGFARQPRRLRADARVRTLAGPAVGWVGAA